MPLDWSTNQEFCMHILWWDSIDFRNHFRFIYLVIQFFFIFSNSTRLKQNIRSCSDHVEKLCTKWWGCEFLNGNISITFFHRKWTGLPQIIIKQINSQIPITSLMKVNEHLQKTVFVMSANDLLWIMFEFYFKICPKLYDYVGTAYKCIIDNLNYFNF